jgi:Xaa-Pro aminopeptidase
MSAAKIEKSGPIPQLVNVDRLVAIMEQRGIDGVVASSHQNLYYLSSLNAVAQKSDEPRPFAVVISRHAPDTPILVMPEYYIGAMARLDSWIEDIRPYRTMISPLDRPASPDDIERFIPKSHSNLNWLKGARDHYAETMIESLGKALSDLELSGKKVAYDDARLGLRLSESAKEIADGFSLLMSARSVKTPIEIDLLRKSTTINQAAIEATIGQYARGMTWFDLNHTYNVAATQNGGFVHDPGALVLASPRGGDASVAFTSEFDDFELEPGMRIMFDCHGTKDLYCWDGGKTWIVEGQPEDMETPEARGTRLAMEEIQAVFTPGKKVSELQILGRETFRKSGVANPEACLLFFHGLGLSHLDQEIGGEVEGSATGDWKLDNQMAIAIHLLVPGGAKERFWLEDIALVTSGGADRIFTWDLNPQIG